MLRPWGQWCGCVAPRATATPRAAAAAPTAPPPPRSPRSPRRAFRSCDNRIKEKARLLTGNGYLGRLLSTPLLLLSCAFSCIAGPPAMHEITGGHAAMRVLDLDPRLTLDGKALAEALTVPPAEVWRTHALPIAARANAGRRPPSRSRRALTLTRRRPRAALAVGAPAAARAHPIVSHARARSARSRAAR